MTILTRGRATVFGRRPRSFAAPLLILLITAVTTPSLLAQDGGGIDSGDTAWILASTALVLFMMIPGLALGYAGLGRSKNGRPRTWTCCLKARRLRRC